MEGKIEFNWVICGYGGEKMVNLGVFKMNMEVKEDFNNKILKLMWERGEEVGLEC